MRAVICLAAILGLIWFGAGALMDIFWCTGCRRSVPSTQALIASTFLAGLIAGLLSAAWAQVAIDRQRERERKLRVAQENGTIRFRNSVQSSEQRQ